MKQPSFCDNVLMSTFKGISDSVTSTVEKDAMSEFHELITNTGFLLTLLIVGTLLGLVVWQGAVRGDLVKAMKNEASLFESNITGSQSKLIRKGEEILELADLRMETADDLLAKSKAFRDSAEANMRTADSSRREARELLSKATKIVNHVIPNKKLKIVLWPSTVEQADLVRVRASLEEKHFISTAVIKLDTLKEVKALFHYAYDGDFDQKVLDKGIDAITEDDIEGIPLVFAIGTVWTESTTISTVKHKIRLFLSNGDEDRLQGRIHISDTELSKGQLKYFTDKVLRGSISTKKTLVPDEVKEILGDIDHEQVRRKTEALLKKVANIVYGGIYDRCVGCDRGTGTDKHGS